MDVKTFLKLTAKPDHNLRRPWIICRDYFIVSVQASSGHYCEPRKDGLVAYDKVELGFPSIKEDLIMEYAENETHPCETVYGYVPIDIVEEIIEKHGGIWRIAVEPDEYVKFDPVAYSMF